MDETTYSVVATIGLSVLGVLWQAFTAFKTANAAREECEQKASLIDWLSHGDSFTMPSTMNPDSLTAEHLSMIACAAYKARADLRMSLAESLGKSDIGVYAWEWQNAAGIIIADKEQSRLIIGIAGTDDAEDVADDANVLRQTLSGWEATSGVPYRLMPHVHGLISSLGFTNHASYAMKGIKRCFDQNDINPDDYKHKWITGHSLGGAVSWLVGQFEVFANAMIFTYGGARPLFLLSKQVERMVPMVRTAGVFDPIQFAPMHYKHPVSKQILILGRRGRWPTIPWVYRPAFAAIAVMYWSVGLSCDILRKLTGQKWIKFSIATGHSMEGLHYSLTSDN